jgi:hypothetical protein
MDQPIIPQKSFCGRTAAIFSCLEAPLTALPTRQHNHGAAQHAASQNDTDGVHHPACAGGLHRSTAQGHMPVA